MARQDVDLRTQVGSVKLPNPVMCASGTAGYGAELARYLDLFALGAVVVKSLSARPWSGNAAPRLQAIGASMINSVGLQNPGLDAWREHELPALLATGARIVVSIWGTTIEEYATLAATIAALPSEVVAVEVNVSCPNLEDRRRMFAHSAAATAEVVRSLDACGRPRWVKLSPNVTDLCEVAGAALAAGAEALTLVNTLMGMAIDTRTRRPWLAAAGGGLSGPALHPVAVRAVYECRAAFPDAAIIGVGGVAGAPDALELLLAGAQAVQVGTATFADPRSPARLVAELERWCNHHGVARIADLIGGAHART